MWRLAWVGLAYSGDGGPATSASLGWAFSVAATSTGAYAYADVTNHRIRLIDTSGIISTIAGNGIAGYCGDGGLATSSCLNNPDGIAVTRTGAFVIADTYNHRIRLVSTSGIISTIAGNGNAAYSGDGGPATLASLSSPRSVAEVAMESFAITDYMNNRVRLVLPSGRIATIAGNGVQGYGGDGGQATSASLNHPVSVSVTSLGAYVIADKENHRIRYVSTAGIITTIAGTGEAAYGGDGGLATLARLNIPEFAVVTSQDAIIISDSANNRIRMISTVGIISTIAGNGMHGYGGDGGPASSASLSYPMGIAISLTGAIVFTDRDNSRIRHIGSPFIASPTTTQTPSLTPYCFPSLFRALPRMDLVGTLVGTALSPGSRVLLPSEESCRQACCDAPFCDGFSFASSDLGVAGATSASCFLYVNITQLIPSSFASSGIYESTL